MTPAESAAFERLVLAAKAHPLALLYDSATIAAAESKARAIAGGHLSRREAIQIIQSLDTPEERNKVRSLLNTVLSPEDSRILTELLLTRCRNALQETETATNAPSTGPCFYLPATCAWYPKRLELPEAIGFVRQLATNHGIRGRVGLGFEGTGDLGNPGSSIDTLHSMIEERFTALATLVIPECVRQGVPVKLTAGNTNDFGKGFKAAWKDTPTNRARYIAAHRQLALRLKAYAPWLIVCALAEDDGSMPADFARATRSAWLEAGFPAARMSAPNRAGGAALNETHISRVASTANAGPHDLASTDNGSGIVAHFSGGDLWTASIPRIDALTTSARTYLTQGAAFEAYHRSTTTFGIVENHDAWSAIVSNLKSVLLAPNYPSTNTARILAITDAGHNHISIRTTGCEDWPEQRGTKTLKARLYIGTHAKPSGEFVDSMTADQVVKGNRKTLENAFGPNGAEHTLDVAHGETVQVWLMAVDKSKRTDPFPFIWPFATT